MFIVVESGHGISSSERAPLTAKEALARFEEAEARGVIVTCLDSNGNPVSKDDLKKAAHRA